MKVAVLYRDLSLDIPKLPAPEEKPVAHASPPVVDSRQDTSHCDSVIEVLGRLGHDAFKVNATIDWLKGLHQGQYELVFNLCDDGFRCRSELEPHVSAVMDVFDIPYTGAGYLSLGMCLDKHLTKKIMEAHGIRTPKYQLFERVDEKLKKSLSFPLIVKPCREDASIGIERSASVDLSLEQLLRLVAQ